jgi:ribosomal protein L21E
MELVDLKLPVKSKKDILKDRESCCLGDSQPIEKEQIDKIPSLMEYKVGDKVVITVEAEVTEVRKMERQSSTGKANQNDYTIEMQVKQVACVSKIGKKPEEMSPKEYKKFRSTM